MNVQKNVCFTSKLQYLNVQKSPGHTIQQPVVGGGTVAVQEPAEFVRFKEHRCLTNSQEVIDFLRKIMDSPKHTGLGIKEIKIRTKQEEYEDEMAKLEEQIRRVNTMKSALNQDAVPRQDNATEESAELQERAERIDEPILTKDEPAKAVANKPFVCWLGKCRAPSATLQGLQKHLNDFHKKHMTKETLVKRLNALAKEDASRNNYREIKGLSQEIN